MDCIVIGYWFFLSFLVVEREKDLRSLVPWRVRRWERLAFSLLFSFLKYQHFLFASCPPFYSIRIEINQMINRMSILLIFLPSHNRSLILRTIILHDYENGHEILSLNFFSFPSFPPSMILWKWMEKRSSAHLDSDLARKGNN